MRRTFFRSLSLAVCFGFACATLAAMAPPAQERAISGRVVDDSGYPLPGIKLSLTTPRKTSRMTVTNLKGQFRFGELADGDYCITVASAPGYYEDADARHQAATYQAGETVTIRLTKGGVIAGQVIDPDGMPLQELRVRAFRVRDEKGERINAQESSAHLTDDRGRYRLFGLRPGAYLVCAEGDPSRIRPSAYRFNGTFWYPSGARTAAFGN